MRTHRVAVAAVVAAVVMAGVWYYVGRGGQAPQVTTQPVTRGDIVESIGATGTLEAVTTVQVGTQVSGTVLALNADFNSVVRKGQVIARLDPSLFQTQLDQARANLAKAEADLDRLRLTETDTKRQLDHARQLSARGLLASEDLATAESAYASAAAQVRSAEASVTQSQASRQQAQVSLDKTVIASPINGIVIARNVDVGQTVAASLQAPTLFVVAADLTKMQVNASVHEADVGQIRPGQAVSFRVDAYPTEEFPGTVSIVRLNPIVQQNVVTYATLIDVPNQNLKLKPGMTATVTIRIAERHGVLRVPNAALRFRPSADVIARLQTTTPQPESAVFRPTPDSPQTGARRSSDTARGRATGPIAGAGRGSRADVPPPGELFGPLEEEASVGQVWLYVNGRLIVRNVSLGISDDTFTELLDSDLPEGTPVVTGVSLSATAPAPAASSTTSNPLMGPQRPGGQRGGGR